MERKIFSPEELKPHGYYRLLTGEEAPVFGTPISPAENFILGMCGESPLWAPMIADTKMIMSKVIPDNVARGMIRANEEFSLEGFTGGLDMFGIDWVYVPDAHGSTVRPGTPFAEDVEELFEKIVWPDVDSWNWDESKAINESYCKTDLALGSTLFTGLFERLISMLDFENAAVALIDPDSKPYIHRLFDKFCGLYEKIIDKLVVCYGIKYITFHDDWGSQRAPLFGLETVQEMLVPYLKRIVDYVHKKGLIFELHCCGCNAPLIPGMIEAGVDFWCPQATANDSRAIFEQFGDQITIGISCPLPPTALEENYIAWGRKYVEECVGRSDKRMPFLFNMRTPGCLRETVYEESRKKLCG